MQLPDYTGAGRLFAESQTLFTMAIAIPIPQISISPAPPQESLDEPFSPFPWATPDADDSFRPMHLTPPPATAKFVRQLSPLRPADASGKVQGKGLEPERFEALLKASRERNAVVVAKRTDLRKEVALKAHKSKQGVPYSRSFFILA